MTVLVAKVNGWLADRPVRTAGLRPNRRWVPFIAVAALLLRRLT